MRDSLANQMGKVFRIMARVYARHLAQFKISPVQANILATLWLEGPLIVGDLQERLMIGSSTVSGAISRMEKAGLVARVPIDGDRRVYRVEPVTWPQKKADGLLDVLLVAEDDTFSNLSAAERKELSRLLTKVIDSKTTWGRH